MEEACFFTSNTPKQSFPFFNSPFRSFHSNQNSMAEEEEDEYESDYEEELNTTVDLISSLSGGWCAKRKRGTCSLGSPAPSTTSISSEQEIASMVKQDNQDSESKELDQDLKFIELKDLENRGIEGKYVCKECGQEFSNFRGLGGHVSSHNRKKRMLEEDFQIELKPKIIIKIDEEEAKLARAKRIKFNVVGKREIHQCNLCDKIFPTGQALGGHKRVHWEGRTVKRFDLNLLPVEARYQNIGL